MTATKNVYNYVLTSPNTKDRMTDFLTLWRIAKNNYLINGADLPLFNLTKVWGMNSERFDRVPDWRAGGKKDRRGHTACYWGHVQEWRQALAERDDDFDQGAAIFFEDDCRLDPDFWFKVFQAYKEVPDDWDVLYFGGQHCVNGRPRPEIYSENLYKVANVNRTHCYSIKLSSLPKIILWFEENRDWGHNFCDPKTGKSEAEVDYALGSLTESGFLNGYALRKWACAQGAGFSWTQGVQEEYRRWDL